MLLAHPTPPSGGKLLNAIVSGDLQPGTTTSQVQLASQHRMSRISPPELLRSLRRERLVDAEHNRAEHGGVVRVESFSRAGLEEIDASCISLLVRRVSALFNIRQLNRPWRGQPAIGDADETAMMLLDFSDNLFAFAYGTPTGEITNGFLGAYFATTGQIQGLTLIDLTGTEWVLPHVSGVHRQIPEQQVLVDIMELVDLGPDGCPSVVTAEHARDVIESAHRAAQIDSTRPPTTPL